MSGIGMKDLQWLLSAPSFGNENNTAKQMRGEYRPDWMEAFIMAKANRDPTVNASTGERHTVQSMVEDLIQRVQLNAITKNASALPPLSVKSASKAKSEAELLNTMGDYILRHFILPEHGRSPVPALYEALKDRFGIQAVINAGGPSVVLDFLSALKEENITPNLADSLPNYDGQPIMVRYDGGTQDNLTLY